MLIEWLKTVFGISVGPMGVMITMKWVLFLPLLILQFVMIKKLWSYKMKLKYAEKQ